MRIISHCLLALVISFLATGCTAGSRFNWETLKGPGFPGWSEQNAVRGSGSDSAKPSGFFTDRRSEQIEKDLGGF